MGGWEDGEEGRRVGWEDGRMELEGGGERTFICVPLAGFFPSGYMYARIIYFKNLFYHLGACWSTHEDTEDAGR
jgi:hypothetical protein